MVEAIILAGGLGTRLRSVVPDTPKCMAPVAGVPFLSYVLDYFIEQGVDRFIFALGYKNNDFSQLIHSKLPESAFLLSVEDEPLGTGGAIQLACKKATQENVLVMNGDTFFAIDISVLNKSHFNNKSDCTICLKPMSEFDRYGAIELDADNFIKSFHEKKFYPKGLINGGIYQLNRQHFLDLGMAEKFSFEKDYLEKFSSDHKMFGLIQDEYFIDIGIPADYKRAQWELKQHLYKNNGGKINWEIIARYKFNKDE